MTDDAFAAFLLNIIIVLSGPLVVELSGYEKTKSRKRLSFIITLLIMSIELLLCMAFPFHLMRNGLGQYDLRTVPLVSAALYGGNLAGFFLFFEFTIVRLISGGPMALDSIAIYSFALLVLILLRTKFMNVNRQWKLVIGSLPMGIILLLSYTVIGILRGHIPQDSLDFAVYAVVNFITLWVSILIMEYSSDKYRMQQEIQYTEKYRLIAELSASIAHEIRNPMTVARGFLQLIQRSTDVPPEPEYVSTAIRELDRAHEIIEQYLSLARPDKEEAVFLEPDKQVQYAVEVLRPYATMRNVSIDYASNGCAGRILANPQKFIQMLVNIAKNGIEAMPQGGKLEITQYCEEPCVVIQISDTGLGMTQDVLSRLGEPYYSTKTGGTGLGLMTSYRICQTMQGKITVTSELGKGSQFTIRIPLSESRQPILQV